MTQITYALILVLSLFAFVMPAGLVSAGQAGAEMPDFLGESQPRAQLLLLGTFHFDDPGLDTHKPEHSFDALSEKRQKEIGELLDLLARFKPTKICVEVTWDRQARLDESYRKFLRGDSEPRADETFQIGFRLAKRLGHQRMYAVDAKGRSYFPDMSQEDYDRRIGALLEGVDPERIAGETAWDERFAKMYTWEDSLNDTQTLREHLIYINDEEVLQRHHGHYLVGSFKLGRGDDYFGADMKTRWYNRNLRIFHNVLRVSNDASDRVLLLIGSGHVPILRHAGLSSPNFELVEVSDVLGRKTKVPAPPRQP